MTNNPTDLQAALHKACEDAAKYLPEPRGISDADVADIIERRLTPVFEALRISEIDECKAALCGYCRRGISVDAEGVHHHSYVQYGEAGERWDSKSHVKCPVLALDALKGAPR